MLVGTATSVETVTSNAIPGRPCLIVSVDCFYPRILFVVTAAGGPGGFKYSPYLRRGNSYG